jgi:hypothetical protein
MELQSRRGARLSSMQCRLYCNTLSHAMWAAVKRNRCARPLHEGPDGLSGVDRFQRPAVRKVAQTQERLNVNTSSA